MTKPKAGRAIKFAQANKELPPCMMGTMADDAASLSELVFACRVQLDLIEEDQDGTEEDDAPAIRRWLKKWTA